MTASQLGFTATTPRPWSGRYRRIPGDTTTFHVRLRNGRWWPIVEWVRGAETATCPMVDEEGVRALADAVNGGKHAQGSAPGGAFLIDEYGRVLVPASDGTGASVFVVGECAGPLRFHDTFDDSAVFDLYDDDGLVPGASWERPYVGLRYQLSSYDELYFWDERDLAAQKIVPPEQDGALVAALRRIRPHGPVRFVVGPGGVVLTKCPPLWEPRYVGRLDLTTWFPKEALK